MPKLFKMQDVVYDILVNDKETRKDDYLLTLKVFEKYIPPTMEIGVAFKYHKELGLPSLHSIIRIRRKLQVEHPELIDDEAKHIRIKEEKQYRQYARR